MLGSSIVELEAQSLAQDVPGGREGSMEPEVEIDTRRSEDRAILCQLALYMRLHDKNLL